MVANYYVKCDVCGKVALVKYQMGFVENHPIRFKCECGITFKGERKDGKISFSNGELLYGGDVDYVVYSSSELLTVMPYRVENPTDIVAFPTPFILATQLMDYLKFRQEFTRVFGYRENMLSEVETVNELFYADNIEMLEKVVRNKLNFTEFYFPMKTVYANLNLGHLAH